MHVYPTVRIAPVLLVVLVGAVATRIARLFQGTARIRNDSCCAMFQRLSGKESSMAAHRRGGRRVGGNRYGSPQVEPYCNEEPKTAFMSLAFYLSLMCVFVFSL